MECLLLGSERNILTLDTDRARDSCVVCFVSFYSLWNVCNIKYAVCFLFFFLLLSRPKTSLFFSTVFLSTYCLVGYVS